jgi:hypothetical protein
VYMYIETKQIELFNKKGDTLNRSKTNIYTLLTFGFG